MFFGMTLIMRELSFIKIVRMAAIADTGNAWRRGATNSARRSAPGGFAGTINAAVCAGFAGRDSSAKTGSAFYARLWEMSAMAMICMKLIAVRDRSLF